MIMGNNNRGLNNLTALLIVQALITFSAHKALAESSCNELLQAEIPFHEFFTPAYNTTASPIILSQVPNPVRAIPPPPQPDPNPVRPIPPPPQPIPTPQPLPETPLDETPTKPPSSAPRPEIPGSITVKKFEFEGNTAFNDEKLRKITKDFTNTPISFARLLQVEAEITKFYTDAGYINSGAFIPADQVFSREGAVVKVEIVEGGIEDIKVTGNRRLNSEYIRSRIRLGVSKPLNRTRLLKALQVLQTNPLIKNISVELSVGSRPEQSLLEVKVVEADSFRTEFFVDNGRVPSVGSFRRGVRINENNLFGFGDRATAQYTNTDGSNTLDLSYSVPLNPRNGTLTLSGGFADTNVIEPPFDRINIVGDYFYVDLSYRQPIIETATEELALGLTLSREQSQTQLLGQNFQLSAGADDNGATRLSVLRFFQEYTQRSPQQVLAFRSQFNLGVGLFDATVNSQPPDSRYFSWRGQGQYVRLLAPDTLFVFRSDAQFATRSLVPLEQFSIGGLQSVRGYRQDQFLVDNGFFASAEFRLPILRVNQVNGLLQIVPFIDFGIGWNSSGDRNPDPNTLVGTGVGLLLQMANQLNARLDYGFPLIDVNSGDRTLQEQGLYFSVNYSPF
ncbi:ShlB/FhaC/HecB family hemolysin secretion/activation protein [Plectonema radiosum NIES-515]|uniref:ShlB/FhaC/HecB family hemolysin secretion/activation protein n=2 Tax=Plectonema TaxID=1183 RepID=A0ABT3AVC9_9CYAN|nr:ShlB/FhaC/HecB family hemolysin secretion/activation protein [Plectonema radiosum NIES-515]